MQERSEVDAALRFLMLLGKCSRVALQILTTTKLCWNKGDFESAGVLQHGLVPYVQRLGLSI